MALRFYFAQIVGAGTSADPCRPALDDHTQTWGADDLRVTSAGVTTGWMIVWAETDAAQHAAALADARVVHLPLEDAAGNPVAPSDPISAIDAAKRTLIQTRLEALHVVFTGLQLTDPCRKILARIVRRIRLRRALGNDDYTEALTATLSSISTGRRNRIANALTARGYDTSVLLASDTIREALRKLAIQDVPWQRNGWD